MSSEFKPPVDSSQDLGLPEINEFGCTRREVALQGGCACSESSGGNNKNQALGQYLEGKERS